MNDIASERGGPMLNPPHLGELIRESIGEAGGNVTGTAARLRARDPLAPDERQGGGIGKDGAGTGGDRLGTADHWMRMQASYELAQAQRKRTVVKQRMQALHT